MQLVNAGALGNLLETSTYQKSFQSNNKKTDRKEDYKQSMKKLYSAPVRGQCNVREWLSRKTCAYAPFTSMRTL